MTDYMRLGSCSGALFTLTRSLPQAVERETVWDEKWKFISLAQEKVKAAVNLFTALGAYEEAGKSYQHFLFHTHGLVLSHSNEHIFRHSCFCL